MSRVDTFSAEFAGNEKQLGMRLASSIQNYTDPNWAEDNLGWNEQKLDEVFDGDLIPTEAELSVVLLHLNKQMATPGNDLQILREWFEGWLETNPPETTVVQTVEEQAGGEVVEEVLPKAVTEPEATPTVATSVTAEVAEVSVEKSADVAANVTWAPDGTSVTIGGQVIDLTPNNKPVRTAMFARLNTLKMGKPWRELTATGDSDQSIYGLKIGSTPVTRHRVDHWVRVLGIDIPILFGIKLDAVRVAVPIPVEESQVEESQVVEVPAETEAEAATTVAALETTEVPAHVEESTTADAQATTETAAAVVASEMTEASATPGAPATVVVERPIEASAEVEVSEIASVVTENEGGVSEQEKSRQFLLKIRHGRGDLTVEVIDLLGDAALHQQSPDFRALAAAEIFYSMMEEPFATKLLNYLEAESGRFASLTFGEFFTALRPKE